MTWTKLAKIVRTEYTDQEVVYICKLCGEVIIRKAKEKLTGFKVLAEVYNHFKKAHPDILKKIAQEQGITLKSLLERIDREVLGKIVGSWTAYVKYIVETLQLVKEREGKFYCTICGEAITDKKPPSELVKTYSEIWKHFKTRHPTIIVEVRKILYGK